MRDTTIKVKRLRMYFLEAMRFKIISFDVEGTLVTRGFSEVIWEEAVPRLFSEKAGISVSEAKAYVMKEYGEVGEERTEWYDIKYWFNRFGLTDYEALLNNYKHEISLYPEVPQVLETLSKNHKLIINSNSAREFLNLEVEKIRGCFHHVFSAPSDFQQLKKATTVYQKVCDLLKVEPAEIVHIGDRWNDDFVAPRKIGIAAYYLDRAGQRSGEFIVKDLEDFAARIGKLEHGSPE